MRYTVTLTLEEREKLLELTKKGKHSAQIIRNALILLNNDQGEYGDRKKSIDIASMLQIGERTVDRIKKLFVEESIYLFKITNRQRGEICFELTGTS